MQVGQNSGTLSLTSGSVMAVSAGASLLKRQVQAADERLARVRRGGKSLQSEHLSLQQRQLNIAFHLFEESDYDPAVRLTPPMHFFLTPPMHFGHFNRYFIWLLVGFMRYDFKMSEEDAIYNSVWQIHCACQHRLCGANPQKGFDPLRDTLYATVVGFEASAKHHKKTSSACSSLAICACQRRLCGANPQKGVWSAS